MLSIVTSSMSSSTPLPSSADAAERRFLDVLSRARTPSSLPTPAWLPARAAWESPAEVPTVDLPPSSSSDAAAAAASSSSLDEGARRLDLAHAAIRGQRAAMRGMKEAHARALIAVRARKAMQRGLDVMATPPLAVRAIPSEADDLEREREVAQRRRVAEAESSARSAASEASAMRDELAAALSRNEELLARLTTAERVIEAEAAATQEADSLKSETAHALRVKSEALERVTHQLEIVAAEKGRLAIADQQAAARGEVDLRAVRSRLIECETALQQERRLATSGAEHAARDARLLERKLEHAARRATAAEQRLVETAARTAAVEAERDAARASEAEAVRLAHAERERDAVVAIERANEVAAHHAATQLLERARAELGEERAGSASKTLELLRERQVQDARQTMLLGLCGAHAMRLARQIEAAQTVLPESSAASAAAGRLRRPKAAGSSSSDGLDAAIDDVEGVDAFGHTMKELERLLGDGEELTQRLQLAAENADDAARLADARAAEAYDKLAFAVDRSVCVDAQWSAVVAAASATASARAAAEGARSACNSGKLASALRTVGARVIATRTALAQTERRRALEEQQRLRSEELQRQLQRQLEGEEAWTHGDGLLSTAAALESSATIAELRAATQQSQVQAAKATQRELEHERRLVNVHRDLEELRALVDAPAEENSLSSAVAATGARLTALQRELEAERRRSADLALARDEALLSESHALENAVAAQQSGEAGVEAMRAELADLRGRNAVTSPLLAHLETELERRTAQMRAQQLSLARLEDAEVLLHAKLTASEVAEAEMIASIDGMRDDGISARIVLQREAEQSALIESTMRELESMTQERALMEQTLVRLSDELSGREPDQEPLDALRLELTAHFEAVRAESEAKLLGATQREIGEAQAAASAARVETASVLRESQADLAEALARAVASESERIILTVALDAARDDASRFDARVKSDAISHGNIVESMESRHIAERVKLNVALEAASTKASRCDARVHALESDVVEHAKQTAALEAASEAATARVHELESDVAEHAKQTVAHEAASEESSARVRALESNVRNHGAIVTSMEDRHVEASKSMQLIEAERAEAEIRAEKLAHELATLRVSSQAVKDEAAVHRDGTGELRQRLTNLTTAARYEAKAQSAAHAAALALAKLRQETAAQESEALETMETLEREVVELRGELATVRGKGAKELERNELLASAQSTKRMNAAARLATANDALAEMGATLKAERGVAVDARAEWSERESALQEQLAELDAKLLKEAARAKAVREAHAAKLKSVAARHAAIEDSAESGAAALAALEAQLNDATSERDSHSADKSALMAQVAALEAKLRKEAARGAAVAAAHSSKLRSAEARHAEVEGAAQSGAAALATLEAELDDATNGRDALMTKLRDAESRLLEEKQNRAKLTSDVNRAQEVQSASAEEQSALKVQVAALETKLAKEAARAKAMGEAHALKMKSVAARHAAIEDSAEIGAAALAALEAQLKDATSERDSQSADQSALKAQVAALEAKLLREAARGAAVAAAHSSKLRSAEARHAEVEGTAQSGAAALATLEAQLLAVSKQESVLEAEHAEFVERSAGSLKETRAAHTADLAALEAKLVKQDTRFELLSTAHGVKLKNAAARLEADAKLRAELEVTLRDVEHRMQESVAAHDAERTKLLSEVETHRRALAIEVKHVESPFISMVHGEAHMEAVHESATHSPIPSPGAKKSVSSTSLKLQTPAVAEIATTIEPVQREERARAVVVAPRQHQVAAMGDVETSVVTGLDQRTHRLAEIPPALAAFTRPTTAPVIEVAEKAKTPAPAPSHAPAPVGVETETEAEAIADVDANANAHDEANAEAGDDDDWLEKARAKLRLDSEAWRASLAMEILDNGAGAGAGAEAEVAAVVPKQAEALPAPASGAQGFFAAMDNFAAIESRLSGR